MRKTVTRLLIFLIRLYQAAWSSLTMPACRYQPTCSSFAIEALNKHGILKGTWLAVKRITSCHPWGGHGHDPVP